jgi:hypothetical protein
MELIIVPDGRNISICGQTYGARERIKALGAKWDRDRNCWRAPMADKDAYLALAQEMKSIPASYPPPRAPQKSRRRSSYRSDMEDFGYYGR